MDWNFKVCMQSVYIAHILKLHATVFLTVQS